MRPIVRTCLAITAAGLLGGCAGNIGYGRIDRPFPVTPQGVQDAFTFARDQPLSKIVISRGLADRLELHDAYLNDRGEICRSPSNSPERCYALSEIRRLYVESWGYSAGEAVGDAATAVMLSPALAVYAVWRANEQAEARRRRAAYNAEREAFAERFGAALPQGLGITDTCRFGQAEPTEPAPDACLIYEVGERETVREAFFHNLIQGGWTQVDAPEAVARFVQTGPQGARRRLDIETVPHAPDPTLVNGPELMVLRLFNR